MRNIGIIIVLFMVVSIGGCVTQVTESPDENIIRVCGQASRSFGLCLLENGASGMSPVQISASCLNRVAPTLKEAQGLFGCCDARTYSFCVPEHCGDINGLNYCAN